jgi:antitoxin (DNA-binding transcriptional repressor) of toxin-antitoxin stability system
MQTNDINDPHLHLAALADRAAAGEEIVLARGGTPIAKLCPLGTKLSKPRRVLGILSGQFHVPDDFDKPLPDDELSRFETG